jgi:large repetitive protein
VSRPADLIVDSIDGDSDAEAGRGLRLQWTVRNQGSGDSIVSSWKDRVMLTRNGTVGDGDDISLNQFTHTGRLNPSQSYTASGTVNVPFSLSGNYFAYVRTDSGSEVFEGTDGENE